MNALLTLVMLSFPISPPEPEIKVGAGWHAGGVHWFIDRTDKDGNFYVLSGYPGPPPYNNVELFPWAFTREEVRDFMKGNLPDGKRFGKRFIVSGGGTRLQILDR